MIFFIAENLTSKSNDVVFWCFVAFDDDSHSADLFYVQLALMSAVRECIDNRDRDRFDVLLLRKEVESLKNFQDLSASKNNSSCSVDTSSQHSAPSEDQSFLTRSGSDLQNSTPLDHNYDPSQNPENNLSFSPVASLNPDLTHPAKLPPLKPIRTSSLSRNCVLDSVSSSATDEEASDKASKENCSQRSNSPFGIAIENHRSSHSGRIKAGNKLTHKPMPDPEFFQDPKNNIEPTNVEPVYSSLIKPIKNPTSNRINVRQISPNANTNSADQDPGASYVSSSEKASSSSFLVNSPAPHPPLQQKITLRPALFGSSGNRKIKSYQRPVKVDVHRDPR